MDESQKPGKEGVDDLVLYLRDVAFFHETGDKPEPHKIPRVYWIAVQCMILLALAGGAALVNWIAVQPAITLLLQYWDLVLHP